MRWQLTLQVVVGLGALYGLGYVAAQRTLEPPMTAAAERTAEANAMAAAAEFSRVWSDKQQERRRFLRALEQTPALKGNLKAGAELDAVLDAALKQEAGRGVLVLLDAAKKPISSRPQEDAKPLLATLEKLAAVQDASAGINVRLEKLPSGVFLVAAAPLARGTVVSMRPLEDGAVRRWANPTMPSKVALFHGDTLLGSTMPKSAGPGLKPSPKRKLSLGDTSYVTASRDLLDERGARLQVVGLSAVDLKAQTALLQQAQVFIGLLGASTLIMMLLLILISPSTRAAPSAPVKAQPAQPSLTSNVSSTGALPVPPLASTKSPAPALSSGASPSNGAPKRATPTGPEMDAGQSIPPGVKPQGGRELADRLVDREALADTAQSPTSREPEGAPSTDTQLALDAESKLESRAPSTPNQGVVPIPELGLDPKPSTPPGKPRTNTIPGIKAVETPPKPQPANSGPAPLPSWAQSEIKSPTAPPTQSPASASPSSFDEVAAAAFAPPAMHSSSENMQVPEDGLMPKDGLSQELLNAGATPTGPVRQSATDLPAPKGVDLSSLPQPPPSFAGSQGAMGSSGPARSPFQPSGDISRPGPGPLSPMGAPNPFSAPPMNPSAPVHGASGEGVRPSAQLASEPEMGSKEHTDLPGLRPGEAPQAPTGTLPPRPDSISPLARQPRLNAPASDGREDFSDSMYRVAAPLGIEGNQHSQMPPPDSSGDVVALPGRQAQPPAPAQPAPPSQPVHAGQDQRLTAPPMPEFGSPGGDTIAYDETHYRVVYNDFVASKARLGESVDSITFEGFRAKLRSSEEALITRHGCKAVRFQVLVKDRTVSLRPQLVR